MRGSSSLGAGGRLGKLARQPTPKQLAFARNIISGMNPSEAYREAGYRCGKPSTVAKEANRLLHNPNVSPIIDKGREEGRKRAQWTLETELERLRAVNDRSFEAITSGGGIRRDESTAFFGSLDRLHDLTNNLPDSENKKEMAVFIDGEGRITNEEVLKAVREGGVIAEPIIFFSYEVPETPGEA